MGLPCLNHQLIYEPYRTNPDMPESVSQEEITLKL